MLNYTKTSAVHVDDAAALFLLAAKKANSGDTFKATSIEGVTTRGLSEAMVSILDLPVKCLSYDDILAKFGEFLAGLLNAKTRRLRLGRRLGWVGMQRD